MILWINGAFGSGKTTLAYELNRRIPGSFVFDPENVGYFIRKNAPKEMLKEDFQDHEIWRETTYSMLHAISTDFSGVIIVPMTIVNPQYLNEIVGKLRAHEVVVRHFALLANRETLLKRLKGRGDSKISWPAKQIDRCITALSQDMFQEHIHTDHLTPNEIMDLIASVCNIELQPDHRGTLKKRIDRLITQIKHIRM